MRSASTLHPFLARKTPTSRSRRSLCNGLSEYLLARGLPITRVRWQPKTASVSNLDEDARAISSLWLIMTAWLTVGKRPVTASPPPLAP